MSGECLFRGIWGGQGRPLLPSPTHTRRHSRSPRAARYSVTYTVACRSHQSQGFAQLRPASTGTYTHITYSAHHLTQLFAPTRPQSHLRGTEGGRGGGGGGGGGGGDSRQFCWSVHTPSYLRSLTQPCLQSTVVKGFFSPCGGVWFLVLTW